MKCGIAALHSILQHFRHCSTDVRGAVTGTITEMQTVGLTSVEFANIQRRKSHNRWYGHFES